jgi:hypothetical protein
LKIVHVEGEEFLRTGFIGCGSVQKIMDMTAPNAFAPGLFEGGNDFGGGEVDELEIFGQMLNSFSSLRGICPDLRIAG